MHAITMRDLTQKAYAGGDLDARVTIWVVENGMLLIISCCSSSQWQREHDFKFAGNHYRMLSKTMVRSVLPYFGTEHLH